MDHAARGPVAAYVLVPYGDGYHLALAEADGARDGADLTRAIRSLPAGVPLVPVPGQSRRLTRADLDACAALGLPEPPYFNGADPVPVGRVLERIGQWAATGRPQALGELGQVYLALGLDREALVARLPATAAEAL